MLELRMASKKFEMESKRSEREKTKQMNKAKVALQKGNEEGARLYLANAAMKQKESLSQLRMAHKLDAVQS
jgi:charged multivesicular body protein 1